MRQAIKAGVLIDGTLYCAGQTGSDLKSGEYPESFEDEVHQTFKRIGLILKRLLDVDQDPDLFDR